MICYGRTKHGYTMNASEYIPKGSIVIVEINENSADIIHISGTQIPGLIDLSLKDNDSSVYILNYYVDIIENSTDNKLYKLVCGRKYDNT
jgi:hypothetical protein